MFWLDVYWHLIKNLDKYAGKGICWNLKQALFLFPFSYSTAKNTHTSGKPKALTSQSILLVCH